MNAPECRELRQRAQAGDRTAAERLLTELTPYVERLARRYAVPGRASNSPSELVQEVELRVWQSLGQFDGTNNPDPWPALRAWVGTMLRHLAANRRRNANRLRRRTPGEPTAPAEIIDPPDKDQTPSANARSSEEAQRVQTALAQLPDGDREIVRLRFFEGVSLREIATRLQLSYDKVRERYQVSKQRLGRALEGLE